MLFFELFSSNPNIIRIEAGQALFAAGDPGQLMYVLTIGRADVFVGERVVETLQPGGIVGELGMLSPSPRSATVLARVDSEFVAIDEKRFQFLVQQTPHFATRVMRVMAERLRAADRMLAQPADA